MQVEIGPNGKKYINDFFVYVADCPVLAPAASFTSNISIEADSEFILVKYAYVADMLGAAQTEGTQVIPLVDVYVTDSGSGRNLQNKGVPISALAGRGQLPMVLPIPRSFKPSANISVTFRNESAGTTYNGLKLCLIGYKRFLMSDN